MSKGTTPPMSMLSLRADKPWIEALDDAVYSQRLGNRTQAFERAIELFVALCGLPPMPDRVIKEEIPPTCRFGNADMLRLLNNADNVKAMYQ